MTFSKAFVLEKLAEAEKYYNELVDFLNSTDEEVNQGGKIHIAERLLQLIVDTFLDINQHFIKELNLEEADDLQNTFYIVGRSKVLDENFSKKIAPVTGLRNRIVHRYESLDKDLFLKYLRKNHSDFKEYMRQISDYLRKS